MQIFFYASTSITIITAFCMFHSLLHTEFVALGLDGEVKECIVLKTQSQLTHYWHVFLCLSFKCEGQKSRECSSSLARQSSQGQKGRKVSANIFLCLYINNNYHSVLHVSFTASYRICCIGFGWGSEGMHCSKNSITIDTLLACFSLSFFQV